MAREKYTLNVKNDKLFVTNGKGTDVLYLTRDGRYYEPDGTKLLMDVSEVFRHAQKSHGMVYEGPVFNYEETSDFDRD